MIDCTLACAAWSTAQAPNAAAGSATDYGWLAAATLIFGAIAILTVLSFLVVATKIVKGRPGPTNSFVEGWGSVVVAIALAVTAGALGFARVLQSQAVATILGALGGYVITKGHLEHRSPPSTDDHEAAP